MFVYPFEPHTWYVCQYRIDCHGDLVAIATGGRLRSTRKFQALLLTATNIPMFERRSQKLRKRSQKIGDRRGTYLMEQNFTVPIFYSAV